MKPARENWEFWNLECIPNVVGTGSVICRRQHPFPRPIFIILQIAVICFVAKAQSLTSTQLSNIRFDQKLNSQISLNLRFRDEHGSTVQLGDYFAKKPVVLVLGYYECPMLCTLTFNGMVQGMKSMSWRIGEQFNVVHVSINPNETPELAGAKKQTYLKLYGRPDAAAGWHFLTGDEAAIRQLADEVGFRYSFDPSVKQYAHPAGLVILTPQGRVAKYLFGVTFSANDLYSALAGASEQKIGSPIAQLAFLCFCYSPINGKYGVIIMTIVRALGAITLGAIAWVLVGTLRQNRRKQPTGRYHAT